MRSVWTRVTIAFVIVVESLSAQSSPGDLLSRALRNPNDDVVLHEVASTFRNTKDPAVLAQLRELFQMVTEKRMRQNLGIFIAVSRSSTSFAVAFREKIRTALQSHSCLI
jgi:hypothetical protein